MDDKNRAGLGRPSFGYWLGQLLELPSAAYHYALGKFEALTASQAMLAEAVPLELPAAAAARLTAAWSKLEASADPADAPDWSVQEQATIERIRAETAACNRNNVTRTEAYRSVYFRTPELHWSLLAHMVSRNGGWNMTDLQGELLPRLLLTGQREAVFLFLEQANAFIFHDAYPQLRLYEWSLREGRSLFHLLPAFGVSRFMLPVWKQFWRDRNPVPLTVALIVNEQNFIERRIVQHPFYSEAVLHTLFFGLQSVLQLNGVLFPYGRQESAKDGATLKLSGLILERFEHLKERIEFGKRLYALLFGIPRVREGARRFAGAVKHTGSRADYAPHLFARTLCGPPETEYAERLLGGRLRQGAKPLYSPELGAAWSDRPLVPPERGDWFRLASDVAPYFQKLPLPHMFEISHEYGFMLNKLELAVLAAQRES
ncbi:DUF2515 domain-containing protein [Paenibacillus sp. N4]|uniref:DUF2515 domain-containing protein n=1 Tax=Paenibacillus vietnamensis TaxID=2590547 RepID=UPI001CD061E2|nr:DUF2515 domain-containing protein [Paenibacillus vietnamensis]MCA0753959.1 DUF2515 domain-containing protein [Paenibacillus vietnamensis]